jgi:flavin reductase (DIM6/NTAB) family NADH-FMN oxidoreductase RutF
MPMTQGQRDFRDALGRFATGVTVVTGLNSVGKPVGLTVSAFSSLSLTPPLVLICLDRATSALDSFLNGQWFVVNILNEAQGDLATAFAEIDGDKFDGVTFETWDSGCPILPDCLANLECATEAAYPGGDHLIVVGRIARSRWAEAGRPLVHFGGAYASLNGGT